ncbi:MAG: 3-dehydroquinate synthase [Kiritimatiellae bacterium]|nr:3-dehydroquinate synthase [Kiritimatiellia bacterium]
MRTGGDRNPTAAPRGRRAERERRLNQRIVVRFDYPVWFTRGVFRPGHHRLLEAITHREPDRRHRVAVFVDSGVAAAWPALTQQISAWAERHSAAVRLVAPPRVVPGGETIKCDLGMIQDLLHLIARSGLCRHSFVIAVGGGAVLDAVGFCASLVHRGLRMIRLPTTVLAQNDAGVGVKTGINTDGGKNTAGTFAPPYAVINDLDFLRTLPDEHWIGGTAEAFKVAILKDRAFFEYLEANAAAIPRRDETVMERLIVRCAELHLEHIRTGEDPFETGAARPLDFGHWAAHQLETLSGYRVSHGQAVATGIALDTLYAARQGWIAAADADRVVAALQRAGFPLWHAELSQRRADGRLALLDGLETFREHVGGNLCLTFPNGLGARRETGNVDPARIADCLEELRRRTTAAPRPV